jgi:hypothetical protein
MCRFAFLFFLLWVSPALAAISINGASVTGTNAASTTLTNSSGQSCSAGDIIVVVTHAPYAHALGAAGTVSSVTGTGLVFQKRSGVTLAGTSGADPYSRQEIWWAYTATGTTLLTYTITYSSTFESATMQAVCVTGFTGTGYITAPWDTNVSIPAIASAEASGTPSVSGVSTTAVNSMLISLASSAPGTSGLSSTPPTGFTFIGTIRNTSATDNSEVLLADKVVSSAQSSITVSWTGTITNWIETVDALTDGSGASTTVPSLNLLGVGK